MSKPVITVEGSMSVSEAVEGFFFKFHHAAFPVMTNGRLTGLLTLTNVRGVNKDDWPTAPVSEAAHKLAPEDTLSPDDSAIDALEKMMSDPEGNLGRFPVVASGELDIERWRDLSYPAAKVREEMHSVDGIGPYAGGNLLKLVGRDDELGIDSWCRNPHESQ